MKTTYYLTAPNPDKRHKDLLSIACASAEEVQLRIEQLGIDIGRALLFAGERVPIVTKTIILLGEQPKRRGRPLGSKNKRKRNKTAVEIKAEPNTVGALIKKKKAKKTKKPVAIAVAPDTVGAIIKKKKSKKLKKPKKKVKQLPAAAIAAEPKRGKLAGETQAERNARVETET